MFFLIRSVISDVVFVLWTVTSRVAIVAWFVLVAVGVTVVSVVTSWMRHLRHFRQDRRLGTALMMAAAQSSPCTVFFSPRGGCTDTIVAAVRQARHTILVQAYSFTSIPIAAALVAAHQRGVLVRIVLDGAQRTAHGCQSPVCRDAGIEVRFDSKHAISHNKVIVLDGSVLLTGSFNFTASAETSNAENLLVISDSVLAATYAANWDVHHAHSDL